MYDNNYLGNRLRAASIANSEAPFAELPDGTKLSYDDLFARSERYAAALISAGLTPGDRVAVQVEKSIEAIELYLGTIIAGGVFLPLNMAYTASELTYFLGDAEPVVFVCDPSHLDVLTPIANQAGTKTVLSLGADGSGTLTDLATTQPGEVSAASRGPKDLAAILYTSGTTGRSKGAMLSHANLASNASTLKDYWRFTDKDVLIHALPIFHTHGLFVATNTTLMAGGSVIFMPKFDADLIMKAMSRATALMGVPTFYVRLLDHPDLTPDHVINMRLFVSGSAPLLAETHELWRARTGHAILERYGMTETNMNTSNPYDGDRRAGTVGFPLPGVDVRITDPETGAQLPDGEVGCIEVRGANVFSGYWRMPEKTREELRENGFFITGDLGVIDADGYLSIIGRSKDLIISGGFNVYPKEVERLIDDIPGVGESAVIGLPHPDFGEGVAAVVVPKTGAELNEAAVSAALKNDLAKFKQPKRVFFAGELPRNTMGKVQKNILREEFKNAFVE